MHFSNGDTEKRTALTQTAGGQSSMVVVINYVVISGDGAGGGPGSGCRSRRGGA